MQQDSVIQYSKSAALKSANSNQEAHKALDKPALDWDDSVAYYSCCGIQFDSLPGFREHLKVGVVSPLKFSHYTRFQLHVAEEKFSCPQCQARFLVENNLKVHVVTQHPNSSNVCPICAKSFHRKASLKAHVQIHQEEEVYPCRRCGEELPTYVSVWMVLKLIVTGGTLECRLETLGASCSGTETLRPANVSLL